MSARRDYTRRRTLTAPLVASAVWIFGVAFAPAAAQELQISHQFHAEYDSRGRAVQAFAAELKRRSPELRIMTHPQLSIGLTRDEQLTALQSGKLAFAVLPFFVASKTIPEFSLALLPGLVPDLAVARTLKNSLIHAEMQKIAAANGLRIVTWWWMRGGFALTAPRPITAEFVSGLTLQSCGLMQELLLNAGAHLGDEPASEVPMLLDMGELDGVAMPYEEFLALRLHEHTKFATFGGPSLITCFSPMLMSKKVWDSLSAEQRLATEDAAVASDNHFERAQEEVEATALRAFENTGVQVRSLTNEEFAGWLKLARETVWARYSQTSERTRDLLQTTIEMMFRCGP